MPKVQRVLSKVRKSVAPRKKKGDTEVKNKDYGVIRIPESLKKKLDILKLAVELMESNAGELSSLSDEALENWTMKTMTQEEFYLLMYDAMLRVYPDAKEYLVVANDTIMMRQSFEGPVRESTREAVKSLVRMAKMDGTTQRDALGGQQMDVKSSFLEEFEQI